MVDLDPNWLTITAAIGSAFVAAVTSWMVASHQTRQRNKTQAIATRKSAYVDLLGSSHDLFEEIQQTYREHYTQSHQDCPEFCTEIRKISSSACRRSADEIRIIGRAESVPKAEALVNHLRIGELIEGRFNNSELRDWRKIYWSRRHSFIKTARDELNLEGLAIDLTKPGNSTKKFPKGDKQHSRS